MKVVNPGEITLSVFFPVYGEERNLEKMTGKTSKVMESLGLKDYEIIIVDDGSIDRTGPLADELAARLPKVRVIHHERNRGYGLALRAGFLAARMDYVFYTDGDIQYDLAEIETLIALIPYTDLAIGFRTRKRYTPYRHLMSFTYNLILRVLFDIPEKDIDCSFKLFPRSLFDRIELSSEGAFIDAEVMLKARALGLRTLEVGVTHLPRLENMSTASSPRAVLVVLSEMFRAWLKYRRQGHL